MKHPEELRTKFLELRARDVSYSHIAEAIGVSKPTLIQWGKAMAEEIADLQSAERELVREKLLGNFEQWLGRQVHHFNRLVPNPKSAIPSLLRVRVSNRVPRFTLSLGERARVRDRLVLRILPSRLRVFVLNPNLKSKIPNPKWTSAANRFRSTPTNPPANSSNDRASKSQKFRKAPASSLPLRLSLVHR